MNERINKIFTHPKYQGHLAKIATHEIGRSYCKHNLLHFLDAARIGYIINLEQGYKLPKDVIYGAALLHDIGRWQQYESGIDHALASSILCKDILKDCDYEPKEIEQIQVAIKNHSTAQLEQEDILSTLLYIADKRSRLCYDCTMETECDWPGEKKSLWITY